jgi:ABC-2 type transport system permease protein
MTSFLSLSKAMARGFIRDRTALFFGIVFPLMFLFLFGGLFKDRGLPKATVLEIGAVSVLDQLPAAARDQFNQVLTVTPAADRDTALQKVRDGDYAAAIEQDGDTVIVHYSLADAVRAGTVQTAMESLVQNANLVAGGVSQPAYQLKGQQVEDASLKTIQYVTPGLLGWAIATSATFGAAATLVTWRQKKILRRLRMAPVAVPAIIGSRVSVSIGVALLQTAIFLGIATTSFFGLKLSQGWWSSLPVLIAGTLAFLSIGLLAGARAKSLEAASAIVNIIVLPMAFLSGSFFPLDGAPGWLQTISKLFPLRHMNDAMLDAMVRGKGFVDVLPQIGLLLAFAAVLSGLAGWLFRWDDV